MHKTFNQFIAENPHFADLQGVREASDQHAYFRNALEKAWNAGFTAGALDQARFEGKLDDIRNSGKTVDNIRAQHVGTLKHADISNATREGIDKRLGASGTPVE